MPVRRSPSRRERRASCSAAGANFRIPYLPAVATASELMAGLAAGFRYFKLFPANVAGGIPALKAFHGPFSERASARPGVSVCKPRASYLELPNVLCVGGSWLTPMDLLKARDWGRIESLAREAAGLASAPLKMRKASDAQ